MNVERMKILQAHLEQVSPVIFDMSVWKCGTAACVAGHACDLFAAECSDYRKRLRGIASGMWGWDEYNFHSLVRQTAIEELGIVDSINRIAGAIFQPQNFADYSFNLAEVTPQQAAGAVEVAWKTQDARKIDEYWKSVLYNPEKEGL